jgi:hypothetical protein
VGDRRQQAALPAQYHRPKIIGPVGERVPGQCVEHEPRPARDLVL